MRHKTTMIAAAAAPKPIPTLAPVLRPELGDGVADGVADVAFAENAVLLNRLLFGGRV